MHLRENTVRIGAKRQGGSFIIEALISLLLFAVGLVALVALATQSLNQVGQTRARNEASNLAGDLAGILWTLPALPATFTTATWADNNTPIDGWVDRVQALPGGSATVTVAGSQVTITITWTDAKGGAGGTTHNYTTATLIAKNT